eukprot:gene2652-2951_t
MQGVAVAIPLLPSFASSIAAASDVKGWYSLLNKPSWTPPNWLFGPVWTALYCMMGLASYLVWRKGGFDLQSAPLTAYAIQLLLNYLWTPLFFKAHQLGLAAVDIVGMWAGIATTIILFRPVIGHLALVLLGPYLAWVSYATGLNLWIWRNNPQRKPKTV